MEKRNPIVHFEIPADDPERAKKFYEEIFGWKITQFEYPGEPYWSVITTEVDEKTHMAKTPGAINGGMMKRKEGQVVTNYINVDDIDAVMKKITSHGGEVLMPKTEIAPGMGWVAMFRDSEGNIMGLHQAPEGMKE